MPYAIRDLDDRSIFLCACLMEAMENGGNLNLSRVITSLKVNKNWAAILLREAKKATAAAINGDKASAVDDGAEKPTKTKRKTLDDENDDGLGKEKRGAKVKKSRAKKAKAEEATEQNEANGENGVSGEAAAL